MFWMCKKTVKVKEGKLTLIFKFQQIFSEYNIKLARASVLYSGAKLFPASNFSSKLVTNCEVTLLMNLCL